MKVVVYLRVSTARQGASGLGLEAQRAAVKAFTDGGGHVITAEFVEVESGKKSDRVQLASALALCRMHRATLIIAKLDRLARNVAFIANLMDGGVDFLACDMPQANRLTLHLMAAMAEHEREMISQRTKAALAVAKARGVKLGNPNGSLHLRAGCGDAARKSGALARSRALDRARAFAPLLQTLAEQGVTRPWEVAQMLNAQGVPSSRGGKWYPEQVRRVSRALGHGHGSSPQHRCA